MSDIRYHFSDDRSEWLEHHGVKGQKWGVRNKDTLRKYAGPIGRSIKGKFDKFNKNRPHPLNNVKNELARRSAANKQSSDMAKAYAGGKYAHPKKYKAFMETRAQTLRAHDPELVAKGMHTLTDSELKDKISRLEQEKKIRDLADAKQKAATDRAVAIENYKKAQKEAKASGIGMKLLTTTYNSTVNYAGKKAVDTAFKSLGIDDKDSGKDKKDNNTTSDSESPKSSSTTSSKSSSTSSSSSGSSKEGSYSQSQQRARDVGESVAAEVLSVETVEPPNESRKKLPPASK